MVAAIALVACKSKNDPSDSGSAGGLKTVYDLIPMYQKSLNEAKAIPLSWGMTLSKESTTEADFNKEHGECGYGINLSASNNYVDEILYEECSEDLSNPVQSIINWFKYHGNVINVNNQKFYFYGIDGAMLEEDGDGIAPITFDEFLNMLDQMKPQGYVGAYVYYFTKEDASYYETHGTLPKQNCKIILGGNGDEEGGEVIIEFGSFEL